MKVPINESAVWVTKKNILRLFSKEASSRIISSGVAYSLSGSVPVLLKGTNAWDADANESHRFVSLFIKDESEKYIELHTKDTWPISHTKVGEFAKPVIRGGHGHSPCIITDWGIVLGKAFGLPTKWRFNAESVCLLPALYAELTFLWRDNILRYERLGELGKSRRRNRATNLAIFRKLGITPAPASDEVNESFSLQNQKSFDLCLKHQSPTFRTYFGRGSNSYAEVTGNEEEGKVVHLSFSFSLENPKLRGKNCKVITKLLDSIRELRRAK